MTILNSSTVMVRARTTRSTVWSRFAASSCATTTTVSDRPSGGGAGFDVTADVMTPPARSRLRAQHAENRPADRDDVVAGERLVGGQGQDRFRQSLGYRKLTAAIPELVGRRLQVDRRVVVHDGLNTVGG